MKDFQKCDGLHVQWVSSIRDYNSFHMVCLDNCLHFAGRSKHWKTFLNVCSSYRCQAQSSFFILPHNHSILLWNRVHKFPSFFWNSVCHSLQHFIILEYIAKWGNSSTWVKPCVLQVGNKFIIYTFQGYGCTKYF